jgi:hypothetical protein
LSKFVAAVSVLSIAFLPALAVEDDGRNLFEWSAVAPIIVAGTSLGEDGRYVEFRVVLALRGDAQAGDMLKIDVRYANRSRDRMLHPKSMRLDSGLDYVLLLEKMEPSKAGGSPFYRIERGVTGAREMPLEGREAYLSALARFVEIQNAGSEELGWHMFEQMLEETDPRLVETSLEQFLKFHRGKPEMMSSLVPLLDHPLDELRAQTARLIGQIVDRYWEDETIPEEEMVRAELVARATRDESVPVRIAATEALGEFPQSLVDEVLDEIAESDPEQEVRYTAELIRLEHRQEDVETAGRQE